jgi:hypothetical protein
MNQATKEIEIQNILKRVDNGMAEISPLITKKLVEEFEKTGISPVFSKNGQITNLKFVKVGVETSLIHYSEWDDLENGIKDYNFVLNDFWFLEYDQTAYPSQSGFFVPNGKLLVVAKKTGKSKEYNAGNVSRFPSDLIQDIKNNFFN